jgi:hypothetical protein
MCLASRAERKNTPLPFRGGRSWKSCKQEQITANVPRSSNSSKTFLEDLARNSSVLFILYFRKDLGPAKRSSMSMARTPTHAAGLSTSFALCRTDAPLYVFDKESGCLTTSRHHVYPSSVKSTPRTGRLVGSQHARDNHPRLNFLTTYLIVEIVPYD